MATVQRQQELADYNYRHFKARHLIEDARRLLRGEGVAPGREAPDSPWRTPPAPGLA